MSQKFFCTSTSCSAVFSNKKSLELHRQRHIHTLALSCLSYDESQRPGATGSIMIADQTPTPSKFLPEGDNNALFPELPNPFDEAFRTAAADVSISLGDHTSDGKVPSTAEIMSGISTPTIPRMDSVILDKLRDELSEGSRGSLNKSVRCSRRTDSLTALDAEILPGEPGSVQSVSSDKSYSSVTASVDARLLNAETDGSASDATPCTEAPNTSVKVTSPSIQTLVQGPDGTVLQVNIAAPVKSTNQQSTVVDVSTHEEKLASVKAEPSSVPLTVIPFKGDNGQTLYQLVAPVTSVPVATADAKKTISDKAKQKLKARLGEHALQGNMRQLAEAASLARSREQKRPAEVVEESAEEKRRKFLEKNRLAAARCRAKRKDWAESLKSKNKALHESLSKLQEEVAQLREENVRLKALLLEHKDCTVTRQQQGSGALAAPRPRAVLLQPTTPPSPTLRLIKAKEEPNEVVTHVVNEEQLQQLIAASTASS